ncbi:hypothetical protein [Candidatus Poriferisodalis sp.]|uniref:hypothetical protein n=1 Tax=Candidatus Poriferisodalis sp. TaxID=3101277 RepID=UPI003B0199B3
MTGPLRAAECASIGYPKPASQHGSRPITAGAVLATVVLAVLAYGCLPSSWETQETAEPAASARADAGAAAETAAPAASATSEPLAPAATVRDCSPQDAANDLAIDTADAVLASVQISRALYDCADEIGLAFADDAEAILTLTARGIRGPLLLIESWSAAEPMTAVPMAELQRLAPERIVAAGLNEQRLAQRLAGFEVEWVPVNPTAALPHREAPHQRVWIVSGTERAAVLGAIGRQVHAAAVPVAAGEDLRALPEAEREMLRDAALVELHADLGPDAAWQLEVIRRGDEVPGGGLLMFEPGRARRLVAMYGHPATSQLGVLGEQDPSEGVARLASIAQGYDADGADVVLAFEIIATVASARAGRDGDYSNETALDDIRPWIEAAAANDMYVVLDLQSGRTDFLTQAKHYEEFLRLPHVGLALDPEWRLRPGEVHLQQIGTVDAAEVNQVVRWLAGLVREEALPQKLLILHQFRFSMITNRELVETPAELAVMIHMDGQGPINTKFSTWNALTGEPDAHRFYWGWKNFYDEDFPTPTAEQVLAQTPSPLFVSYQ